MSGRNDVRRSMSPSFPRCSVERGSFGPSIPALVAQRKEEGKEEDDQPKKGRKLQPRRFRQIQQVPLRSARGKMAGQRLTNTRNQTARGDLPL